jgi:hypothetical protein
VCSARAAPRAFQAQNTPWQPRPHVKIPSP